MSLAVAHVVTGSAPQRDLEYLPKQGPAGLACWLALPPRISADEPPIVAVHGIRRNARQQAELFAERANALGRPVIAPLFEKEQWPRYQRAIQRGRADLALMTLMARLRRDGIWRTPQFELFGFSGGAQFAHRFAMLYPEAVTRLTTASAGWYTFPEARRFPYGFLPRPDRADPWSAVTDEKIERFLAIPTQVCVGADDNICDRNTRSGPKIDAQQGRHRLARAIKWTQALQDAARQRGMAPRAVFIALSACGHDFRQCVVRGGLDRIVIPDEAPAAQNCPASGCSDAERRGCARLCSRPWPFPDPSS